MSTVVPPPEPATQASGPGPAALAPSGRRRRLVLVAGAATLTAAVTAFTVFLLNRAEEPARTTVPPPSPSPPTLEPVENLEAEAGPFEVELTWEAPVGEAVADGYGVYRDGELLEHLGGSTFGFTDDTVLPERSYEFAVRAHAGQVSAQEVTVDVTTPPVPLALARLAGAYNVKARTVSTSGIGEYPTDQTRAWRMKPRCKEGPCGVLWSDLFRRHERIRLQRKGRVYEGSGDTTAFIECQGVVARSSVEIRLKVDRAQVLGRSWTATRLTGTLTHAEAAQLGCIAGRAELAIRAIRVR